MKFKDTLSRWIALLGVTCAVAPVNAQIAIDPSQPAYGDTLYALIRTFRLAGCDNPEDFDYEVTHQIVEDPDTNLGVLQRFVVTESFTGELNISCDVVSEQQVKVELGPAEYLDVEVIFKEVDRGQPIDEVTRRFELPTLLRATVTGTPSPVSPLRFSGIGICNQTPTTVDDRKIIVEHETANCGPEPGFQQVGPVSPGVYQIISRFSIPTGGWTQVSTVEVPSALPPASSGSWYDPDQPGHGLSLQVLPNGRLIGYWYVFDPDGNPAWIHFDGMVTLAEAGRIIVSAQGFIVQGGRFLPDFDPEVTELIHWGNIELEFTACDEAVLRFAPDIEGWSSGEVDITQLAAIDRVGCNGL